MRSGGSPFEVGYKSGRHRLYFFFKQNIIHSGVHRWHGRMVMVYQKESLKTVGHSLGLPGASEGPQDQRHPADLGAADLGQ